VSILSGYVKIHRKLIQWGWYKNSVVKDTFLHLIFTANFKDMPWEGITIKRGQVVTSYESLADDLGFSIQQVRTAIKKLKSTGEITTQATNRYTIVTVVNFDDYQSTDENLTDEITSNATNKQQTNNKQITNNQQQRKNDKNDKNNKNIYSEINSLIFEYTDNKELQQALIDFIEMRKRIKKPLATKRAFTILTNKLKAYNEQTQIKMLDNAIEKNWLSVYQIAEEEPRRFEYLD